MQTKFARSDLNQWTGFSFHNISRYDASAAEQSKGKTRGDLYGLSAMMPEDSR
jgi:hypothetical protein